MSRTLFPGVLLASALAGCGAAPPSSALRVALGEDATGRFPSVVKLYPADEPDGITCTGNFIAPRLLLTAARCYREGGDGYPVLAVNGETLRRVYMHPRFNDGVLDRPEDDDDDLTVQPYRAFDVALVVFDHDATPAVAPLATTLPRVDQRVRLVGFGDSEVYHHSDGSYEVIGGRGPKRTGTTRLTHAGSLLHSGGDLLSGAPDQAVVGAGDSGGPLFAMGSDDAGDAGDGADDSDGNALRQLGVASGAGAVGHVGRSLHVRLASAYTHVFYAWLAAAPRCIAIGGHLPPADCRPSVNDGRLPIPR